MTNPAKDYACKAYEKKNARAGIYVTGSELCDTGARMLRKLTRFEFLEVMPK